MTPARPRHLFVWVAVETTGVLFGALLYQSLHNLFSWDTPEHILANLAASLPISGAGIITAIGLDSRSRHPGLTDSSSQPPTNLAYLMWKGRTQSRVVLLAPLATFVAVDFGLALVHVGIPFLWPVTAVCVATFTIWPHISVGLWYPA